jgi:hypothetical protein
VEAESAFRYHVEVIALVVKTEHFLRLMVLLCIGKARDHRQFIDTKTLKLGARLECFPDFFVVFHGWMFF